MKSSHPKRCAPCASRKSSPAEVVALLKKAEELELKSEAQRATKAPGKGVKREGRL